MFTSYDVHICSLFLKSSLRNVFSILLYIILYYIILYYIILYYIILVIYIHIYVFKFSFPCCSVGFFLSMIGNILWRRSGWWKTCENFPYDFRKHTYKVNIPMFHPAYPDFLNSICPWKNYIHVYTSRKM